MTMHRTTRSATHPAAARRRIRALAVVALALATLAAPAAVAGAPTTDLQPERLERGDDVRIPHVEGTTFVDGERRVAFDDVVALRLLGRDGDAFLLSSSDGTGREGHVVWRLEADDTRTALRRRIDPWVVRASDDGAHLVAGRFRRDGTVVRVWSSRDGDRVAKRRFGEYREVLDAGWDEVVLGSWTGRTVVWDHRRDSTRRVAGRRAYAADISTDRLARFTGDPYDDGCTVVTTLTRPRQRFARTCRQAVVEFSPDGRRMLTVHELSDGLGPSAVQLRRIGGRKLATYTTAWFGAVGFETERAVLLEVHGRRKQAVVRCVRAECENATDPERVRQPRR